MLEQRPVRQPNDRRNPMRRSLLLAALAAGLCLTATAVAERVPSAKQPTYPATGARPDITIPYTTNFGTTLGVANGVAPYIYNSKGVSNVNNGTQRPTFNLIFYGSSLQPSSQFGGAMQRPPNDLRGNNRP